MGLFDFFKKKENKQYNSTSNENTQKKIIRGNIVYDYTKDGKMQIELFNPDSQFRDFYDTTRLIISSKTNINSEIPVYSCKLSHYSIEDAILLDPRGNDMGRRERYSNILAQFDYEQLKNPDYAEFLLKKLCDKKRVDEYLNMGMQDNPEKKCGNYIGGIKNTEKGLRKFFSYDIGDMVHNMPYMVKARRTEKEIIEARKEAKRKRLEEKLKALEK